MNDPALDRYSEADEGISALYEFLTEQVENRNVSTREVPDEVHEEAIYQVLDQSQVPQEMFRGKSTDDVELLLGQYSHDSSQLAQDYLDSVKQIDERVNGRDEHDRKIDALIQHYMEDGIEDHDLIFRETDVEDQDHSVEDSEVELTGRRNYEERPATDADFWIADLENERLLFQEEKSSDNYDDRKNRQLQDIRDAVEAVNQELEADYDVETQPRADHNLTETRYPMPDVYEGDVHVADDVEETDVKEFEKFINSFLHELSYDDLEPLTNATPNYSEAL